MMQGASQAPFTGSQDPMDRLTGDGMLVTAAGRIRCRRCAARSKRTHDRCRAPAMQGKAVCRFHGGRSTGPRTPQGKARIAARLLKHGQRTREGDRQRKAAFDRLRALVALGHCIGLFR